MVQVHILLTPISFNSVFFNIQFHQFQITNYFSRFNKTAILLVEQFRRIENPVVSYSATVRPAIKLQVRGVVWDMLNSYQLLNECGHVPKSVLLIKNTNCQKKHI